MGGFGLVQVLILVLVFLFPIVCFWRILPRTGYSSWLSLLCIIPFGMFVLLGIIAFSKWPNQLQSPEVFN